MSPHRLENYLIIVYVDLHSSDYLKNITPRIDMNSLKHYHSKTKQSLKDYITFVANYTCSILWRQHIELFFKENLDKSIFDLITVSNEAFAIILVENNKEKWIDQADEEHELKENGFIARPNREPVEIKKAKWTVALKKRKNVLYVDNWSGEKKKQIQQSGKKTPQILREQVYPQSPCWGMAWMGCTHKHLPHSTITKWVRWRELWSCKAWKNEYDHGTSQAAIDSNGGIWLCSDLWNLIIIFLLQNLINVTLLTFETKHGACW